MQTKFPYHINDIDFINNFYNNISKGIKKARVYVKNPSEVPQGAKLERGKHGGMFYETSTQHHFIEEVSNIERNIKSQMKFSDSDEKSAENAISKHASIAKDEFIRISNLFGSGVSYRLKNKYAILEKLKRKNYSISDMKDILGMRIEVNNVDDIYTAVKKLEDVYGSMIIIKEDKVKNPLGLYRAYHLNIKYSNDIYSEIQVRTLLMDKIANASHVLLYKNTSQIDENIKRNINETLETYSNIAVNKATQNDLKMLPETKKILSRFGL